MDISLESISELRQSFEDKLNEQNEVFHPMDLAKINNSDSWLKRFLIHTEGNQEEALSMLWNVCEWRKSFGVNEISESNGTVRIDYLEEGIMFPHGVDKDGKLMFIIRCKLHFKASKDSEECKKCAVYWFERMERLTNGDQITIFFDMMGSGLSNLDMEFTNYLINLLKMYYPAFLNYIIIFEMPWVLNAAFKIIKTWLPAKAVKKIKFLSKHNLNEFVSKESIMVSWGGEDNYKFNFEPETKKVEETKKKVHFAETMEVKNCSGDIRDIVCMPKDLKLKINPSEVLTFNKDNSNGYNELMASVTFINDFKDPIAFKIKTTCLVKYKVRPSTGTLMPQESIKVTFVLNGMSIKQTDVMKDKFLVLVMPVVDPKGIAEMWKMQWETKEQHILKCKIFNENETVNTWNSYDQNHNNDLEQKVDRLMKVVTTLEMSNRVLSQHMRYVKYSLYIILLMCLFAFGFFWAVFYHK